MSSSVSWRTVVWHESVVAARSAGSRGPCGEVQPGAGRPREILLSRRYRRARRAAASPGSYPSTADDKGKENTHSSPLSIYSAPGGLRQDPGRAAEWLTEARTCGMGVAKCVRCC